MQNSAVAYRRLGSVSTLASVPGDSLTSIVVTPLDDGAICWVQEEKNDFQLDKFSTLAPDGTNVLAATGGGNWLRVGGGTVVTGGFEFLTQPLWAVNSITGNDNNPGSSTLPLQSLPELARRWQARIYSPGVPNVSVQLTGDFSLSALSLMAAAAGNTDIEVLGVMTQTAGPLTIGVYTAEAPPTRASLTVAGFDFSVHLRSRMRMITGTQTGAVANVMSAPALGTANISQFERVVNGAISTVNPTAGDQFVIETYATRVREYDVQLGGVPVFRMRDLVIGSTVSSYIPQNYMNIAGLATNRGQVFGCRIDGAAGASQLVRGAQTFGGCGITVPFWTVSSGTHTMQGLAQYAFIQTSTGANVIANRWCADGNGTAHVGFLLGNGSYCEDIAPRGMFGCINGTIAELVRIEDFAQWVESSGTAVFYGAAGNTTTNALRCRNGTGFVYVTLPTATGATPGADVVLGTAAAVAWATLPSSGVPPNNAFANVR